MILSHSTHYYDLPASPSYPTFFVVVLCLAAHGVQLPPVLCLWSQKVLYHNQGNEEKRS